MKSHYIILLVLFVQQIFAKSNTTMDPPTVSISYLSAEFCQSELSAIAIMSGTGNYTGGTFSSTGAGLMINAVTGEISPSQSSPGTYEITYTLPANGSDPEFNATTAVTIVPMPMAVVGTFQNSVCSGQATAFCITGTPFATVVYSLNNSGVFSVVLDAAGSSCIMTAPIDMTTVCNLISVTSAGTPSCTTILSTTATVTVEGLPQIQLPPTAEIGIDGNGEVVSPLLLDSQPDGVYAFKWYLDGILIPGADESTYLVTTASASDAPRQYTVEATSLFNVCQNAVSCWVTKTLGLADFVNQDIKFGPNPFSDIFTLAASEKISAVTIHNLAGQLVYQKQFNDNEIKLSLSELPSGTYFVTVSSLAGKRVFKAVKK